MTYGTVQLRTPPEEPPAQIRSEILWRLAVRLFREHEFEPAIEPEAPGRCVRCGQPWPCSGRRLAELGLGAAAE